MDLLEKVILHTYHITYSRRPLRLLGEPSTEAFYVNRQSAHTVEFLRAISESTSVHGIYSVCSWSSVTLTLRTRTDLAAPRSKIIMHVKRGMVGRCLHHRLVNPLSLLPQGVESVLLPQQGQISVETSLRRGPRAMRRLSLAFLRNRSA